MKTLIAAVLTTGLFMSNAVQANEDITVQDVTTKFVKANIEWVGQNIASQIKFDVQKVVYAIQMTPSQEEQVQLAKTKVTITDLENDGE